MGVDLDLGKAELVGQGQKSKVKVKFLAHSIRSYLIFFIFIAILLKLLRGLNGGTIWPLTLIFGMGVDLDFGQAKLVGQGRRSKVKVKF